MDKILISRTDGIGDLLLTTPLIHELRVKYPQANITVLASRYAAPVLENNPDVTTVMLYDKKEHRQAMKVLKNTDFDAVVAVYPRPNLAWGFFRSRIPKRIGTARRWYSFLYNERVNISRRDPSKHEADYNLDLMSAYIGNLTASREYYYMTEKEKEFAGSYISRYGLEKGGFLVVHPGSKGSAWNLSQGRYIELVEKLCAAGHRVMLTGGPAEKHMLRIMHDRIADKKRLEVMEEEFSVRDFTAVLSMASAVISCSTGPMHLAAAVGTKTLSFFPPDTIAPMRAGRWKPLGNDCEILTPKYAVTEEKEKAMDSIDLEVVLTRLGELLKR